MFPPDPAVQIRQILESLDPKERANLLAELKMRVASEPDAQGRESGHFQDALTEALLSGKYPDLLARVERTTASLEPEVLADRLLAELDLQLTPREASELREKVAEHFLDTMMNTMMSRMNDAQFEEFKAVMGGDPDRIETGVAMITARIPGLLQVITEQMTREYEGLKAALQS